MQHFWKSMISYDDDNPPEHLQGGGQGVSEGGASLQQGEDELMM
jgi:hypothetical protein